MMIKAKSRLVGATQSKTRKPVGVTEVFKDGVVWEITLFVLVAEPFEIAGSD